MSGSAHPAGPRHGDVLPEGHYQAPPADLNALDPKVWSRTVARNAGGVATVGGIDVTALGAGFGKRRASGAGRAPGGAPSAPTRTSTTPARRSSPRRSCAGCTRRA